MSNTGNQFWREQCISDFLFVAIVNNGWIKLHRKLKEKGFYQNSAYVHLWIHLLLSANHRAKEFMFNGKIIIIKEGQLLTGRKQLASATGLSESMVERALNLFENEQQIEQQKTTKNRIITIIKWYQYQISDNETDSKRTTTEQQADTNKNDKNVENEKKRTFLVGSPEYQLSLHLFNGIRSNDSKAKEPDLQKWASEIDKLIRIDKRTPEEIAKVIEFSQSDSFWKSNILSTATLRKQFPKLFLKASNGTSSNKSSYRHDPEKFRRLAAEFAKDK